MLRATVFSRLVAPLCLLAVVGCASDMAPRAVRLTAGGQQRVSGKPEGTAWLENFKKAAQSDEIVVDSNEQEAHYAPDGHGSFYFAYWIIHYRDDANTCYFWDTINAKAFTQTGDAQYCGQAPDTQVFYTTHIKKSDVVK